MPEKKPRKASPRSTTEELRRRIDIVIGLRLNGARIGDVFAFSSKPEAEGLKPWGITRRQAEKYVRMADRRIRQEISAEDREAKHKAHTAKRRLIYARCMAVGDYATAARVLSDEAKLEGLYPKPDPAEQQGATLVIQVVGIDENAALGKSTASRVNGFHFANGHSL